MESRWSDQDAEAIIARYAEEDVSRDLALRVYTSRLLGGEPRLVLHGGGNTSVKTTLLDVHGDAVDVICVKGSGWDMASIEPAGLPAVRLEPLRRLLALDALTDEAMVNVQRCNLLDSTAPTPSVETLLHAFLPHTFIDHTHANAILALTDQPDGAGVCRELFGDRVVIVPYVMPGFELSKAAHAAYESNPSAIGMVLVKHGLFTFGETAREAYERTIDLVTEAETRLAAARRPLAPGPAVGDAAPASEVAPILRGLLALRDDGDDGQAGVRPFVLSHRAGPAVMEYVNGAEADRYARAGVVTPDHAIRIKPWPVLLPAARAGRLDEFADAARGSIAAFADAYRAYFARHDARSGGRVALDPMPRVLLVPGLGVFAAGRTAKDARIAGDLAEATAEVIADAESLGRFESISEAETFDIEYWSLEQAKLATRVERALSGHVALVTGGAGTIGYATASRFAALGAEIVLLDAAEAVTERAATLGGLGVPCDVTSPEAVEAAVAAACGHFGGVDIVVSNAGAAWQGRIAEVDDATLRASFELNFFAHQSVARAAVRVMRAQATGGALLFNVSKQAVNPGPGFGPYGLPKAATMALVRQYAVDYGADSIRANGVNADRIRSGLLTDEMIASRSGARGVTEKTYMSGNLLQREVTADDVADAFVSLALAPSTTGAIVTVDGGNIAAALR
jgi:rhamnose utilization protein RhaD (predicted bifunctional aldolase and dehydrogenase)/NAD(P)-dependent dehydrogenase (short-subunit alcohol dehydrogenase family)